MPGFLEEKNKATWHTPAVAAAILGLGLYVALKRRTSPVERFVLASSTHGTRGTLDVDDDLVELKDWWKTTCASNGLPDRSTLPTNIIQEYRNLKTEQSQLTGTAFWDAFSRRSGFEST